MGESIKILDDVLRCPACILSSGTLSVKRMQGGGISLRCACCRREFAQDKANNFFSLYTGVCRSMGSRAEKEEIEGSFFTNRAFKELCLAAQHLSLRKALGRCRPKIVADIGCGTGEYALHLKGLYERYYGLEPFDVPVEVAVQKAALPESAVLVRYDSTQGLPVNKNAADTVLFIASYDHIANPEEVMRDAWSKLKDGGHLVIMCSNYSFWAKRLVNVITGKKMFQHKEAHFSVYSPASLIEEVRSFVRAEVEYIDADFFLLPNLPQPLSFLYFSTHGMKLANFFLKRLFSLFSMREEGSGMIVVFKKQKQAP